MAEAELFGALREAVGYHLLLVDHTSVASPSSQAHAGP
jgi:hypothetical protein